MPKAIIEYPDDIVNRAGNKGWHRKGKRAYRNAVRTIMQCLQTYRQPRLYHLCFEGQTHKVQMKMLNGMVQIADRAGIKLEWFACREVADRTKKAHIHAFMIIDAYGGNPYRVFNQFDDGQVAELCTRHRVNFSIFSPKDDLGIHGNTDYMTLPYQGPGNKQTARGGERLKDALRWLTYCFKARSKPLEEEADGQIFPASRPNRKRKTLDASPLADLSAPVQNVGAEMTPAADEAVQTLTKEENDESSIATKQEDSKPASASECIKALVRTRQDASNSQEAGSQQEASPSIKHDSGNGTGSYYERPQMILTAQQKYLASLYESCIDADLDIDEIRHYLLQRGVLKTPGQVAWELENVYGFHRYAEMHPPKPVISVETWDRTVYRMGLSNTVLV